MFPEADKVWEFPGNVGDYQVCELNQRMLLYYTLQTYIFKGVLSCWNEGVFKVNSMFNVIHVCSSKFKRNHR